MNNLTVLGHANNLRDSGAGYALSRSSIHLNRLHDVINQHMLLYLYDMLEIK